MSSTLAQLVRDSGFHQQQDEQYQLRLQRQSSIDVQEPFAIHEESEEAKYHSSDDDVSVTSPFPAPKPSSSFSSSIRPLASTLSYHPFPQRQVSAPPQISSVGPSFTQPLSLSDLLGPPSPRRSSSLFAQSSPLMREDSASPMTMDPASSYSSFDLMRTTSNGGPLSPDASPWSPVSAGEDGAGSPEHETAAMRAFKRKVRAAFDENAHRLEQRMQHMEERMRQQLLAQVDERQQLLADTIRRESSKSPFPEERKEQSAGGAGAEALREEVEHLRELVKGLKKRTVQLTVREENREQQLDELQRTLSVTLAQSTDAHESTAARVAQRLKEQQASIEQLERRLAQMTQSASGTSALHASVTLGNTAGGVWPGGLALPDGTMLMVTHGAVAPVTLHSLSTRLARAEHELSTHARGFNDQVSALQSALSTLSSSSSAALHASLQPVKASLKHLQTFADDVPVLQRRVLLVEEEGRRVRSRHEDDWAAMKASLDRTRADSETERRRAEEVVAAAQGSQDDAAAVERQRRQWAEEDRHERLREEKREREERARQWKEDRTAQQKEHTALLDDVRVTAQKTVKDGLAEVDKAVQAAVKDHWVAEKDDRGWSELRAQVERAERRLYEEGEGVRRVHHEMREVRDGLSRLRLHVEGALVDVRASVKAAAVSAPPPLPPQTFHIHAPAASTPSPLSPSPVVVATPPAPAAVPSPSPAVAVPSRETATHASLSVPAAAERSSGSSPVTPLQPTAFVWPPAVPDMLNSIASVALSKTDADASTATRSAVAVPPPSVAEADRHREREAEREAEKGSERGSSRGSSRGRRRGSGRRRRSAPPKQPLYSAPPTRGSAQRTRSSADESPQLQRRIAGGRRKRSQRSARCSSRRRSRR